MVSGSAWNGSFRRSATAAVALLLSYYLQYLNGYGPETAGLILVAQPIVQAAVSPLTGRLSGHPRPIIGLGDTLSWLQAFALELLPVKLMSRDNLASMTVDNVSSAPFPFGIEPAAIEGVAPLWFSTATPRGRYTGFRSHAGRSR